MDAATSLACGSKGGGGAGAQTGEDRPQPGTATSTMPSAEMRTG